MENSVTDSCDSKPVPQPAVPYATVSRKTTSLGLDRLKNAKTVADQAIKNNKIFTIQGPYPAIREGLRKRGWVEKFYSMSSTPKPSPPTKKSKSLNKSSTDENNNGDRDDDDDDDDTDDSCDGDGNQIDLNDHGGTIAPWEEENGFYGVTSRLVKNANPMFIWGVRRDVIDPKLLTKEQMVNHYGHASFTTKVGLCTHLRNLPWYQPTDSSSFFPRCYRLSHEDEKQEFIDDFFLTACVSLLKHISADTQDNTSADAQCNTSEGLQKNTTTITLPMEAVEIAMDQCRKYLQSLDHDDIDQPNQQVSEKEFESFINWYYQALYKNAKVDGVSTYLLEISSILSRLKENWPQYEIDGTKNVWIVKPGAKSRGRGIQCYNSLDEMLKLVNSQVARKEGKYVVQKYIERPLLLYRTKFDIRQWFLVTDWNPLTMWFYKECYLRFCSQEYTLDSFDESIHLSNNAIQKNYKNGVRAAELPNDNMWTSDDFKEHLELVKELKLGLGHLWDELIYPGMKDAITAALLCCQDDVEQRKSAFELYGADFMLDESYHPWLIEINSSPCMAPSTKITSRMCSQVLEDTIRVVLDRKADKNADVGLFELAYKQPWVVIPQYIGISLQVDGMAVKTTDCHTSRRNQGRELASPVAESQALPLLSENKKPNLSSDEILSIKGEKWQRETSVELPRKSDSLPPAMSDHDDSDKNIQIEETPTRVVKKVKKPVNVRRCRNTKKIRAENIGGTDDADRDVNTDSPGEGEPRVATNRAEVVTAFTKNMPRCRSSHVPLLRNYHRKKENVVDTEETKMVGSSSSDSEERKILTTSDNEEGKLPRSSENAAMGGSDDKENKVTTLRTGVKKAIFRSLSEDRKTDNGSLLQLCPKASDFVPDLKVAYKTSFITSSNNEDTAQTTQLTMQLNRETMPLKRKFKATGTADSISVQGSRLLKPVNIPYNMPMHAKALTEFPLVLRSLENSHGSNFILTAKTSKKDQTVSNTVTGRVVQPDGSTRTGQDSSNSNPLPPNISQIPQTYAMKPASSFMIGTWKPPGPPTASNHFLSDSWRARVALSLYAKARHQSTHQPNQKKFVLKYTNASFEKPSVPGRLPVGFPSLVSQYLERNYPEGQQSRSFRAMRSQTPHLSIVTQSFNAW